MHVHNHLPLEELQRRTDSITGTRPWKRHQAVVLATQGLSADAIGQALGCSRRAVQGWITRYNQLGPNALQEGTHTGRPLLLAGPELLRFQRRVEAGPRPEDGI